MEFLVDEGITMDAFYRTGGFGKAALVETLNNNLLASELFEMIIWVLVSNKGLNVRKVQSQVVERLSLALNAEVSIEGRAYKLCRVLKSGKRLC